MNIDSVLHIFIQFHCKSILQIKAALTAVMYYQTFMFWYHIQQCVSKTAMYMCNQSVSIQGVQIVGLSSKLKQLVYPLDAVCELLL